MFSRSETKFSQSSSSWTVEAAAALEVRASLLHLSPRASPGTPVCMGQPPTSLCQGKPLSPVRQDLTFSEDFSIWKRCSAQAEPPSSPV
ncbi:hypothetical protein AOLI_G00024380 [Acnodon oligacanthus]